MAEYKTHLDEKYAQLGKLRIESEMSAFSNKDDGISPTKLPDIGNRNILQSDLKTQGGGLADI
jgi:hypothetical protein